MSRHRLDERGPSRYAYLPSKESHGFTDMAVLVVRHVTTYRYKRPVRLGEHRLMFRPRDSFDQRLLHSHLAIVPQPSRLRWIHDVFGNCVTMFDFDTSTTSLEVASIIRLEHTPERAPDFQIEEYAKLHPFDYHPEQLPDLSSCVESQLPDPDHEVITWLRSFVSLGQRQPTGRLLMTLKRPFGMISRVQTRSTRSCPNEIWLS